MDKTEDLYLSQFVIEPTFQLDNEICNNTLDLIFSEFPERINDGICHLPPLGKLVKAHHILKWKFKLKSPRSNSNKQKGMKLFKRGKYDEMEDFSITSIGV